MKRRGFILTLLLAPFSRWLPKEPTKVIAWGFLTDNNDVLGHMTIAKGCIYCINETDEFECVVCGRGFTPVSWPTPKNAHFPTEYVKLETERANKDFYKALFSKRIL